MPCFVEQCTILGGSFKRSTTVPYFDDEFTENEVRPARGDDGKTYHVPSNMTYSEWKKTFVDGDTSELKEVGDSSGVRQDAQKINKLTNEEQEKVNSRRAEYFERQRQKSKNTYNDVINTIKPKTKPDFSAMSASEIKDYANNTLKTEFVGMEGANNDFIRGAVKVIDDFERMNGGTIDGLKVRFGGTPSGVFAKYDDKTNTLLLKKTGSIQAYEQKQIEDNLRYKIKWGKNKDYYATTTYSGTVAHELGHAVDFSTNQALSNALSSTSGLDELSVKISAYAGNSQNVRVSKRSEAWAENFAAYMEGGEKAKEVPSEIADMIEGYFKKNPLENVSKSSTIKATKTISGHAGTPKMAEPNAVIDHINDDGKVDARSFHNGEGVKVKDIHTTNHGNPKQHNYGEHGEHGHDYDWNEDGSLKNKTTRNLTEEERKENGDIL